jgi:uncharacterized membrane protein
VARAPRIALGAAIVAYAGVFSTFAVLRHRAFETGRFDLGNMMQAVWSTAEGRPLEVTGLRGDQFVRLGAHFDPILALFAPLWRAWPSPELLLVAQALLLSLGALPVFWLARKHLGSERSALALAIAYLLAPALQWMTLADFHPVALATPLLLFAVWYLEEGRLAAFAAFAVLAVATKEHIGLVVAGLGLWYALSRRPRAGVAIAVAAAAVSVLAVLAIVPHFSPLDRSAFEGRYDDPALERRDGVYLFQLLAPTAGLSLLSPLLALAAVPELALNLLSEAATQTSIRYQYSAAALAILYAAAARVARGPLSLAVLGASLAAAVALGPGFPARPDAHDQAAERALRLIPDNAAACATNSLGAHLSERRRIFSFPFCAEAEWLAVDRRSPSYGDGRDATRFRQALRELRGWRVVFAEDGVVVLRSERSGEGDTR